MPDDINAIPAIKDGNEPDSKPTSRTGTDPSALAVVANIALLGVPSAYIMSHSVVVTLITAAAAVALVTAYLPRSAR